jgi:hypothetical protein
LLVLQGSLAGRLVVHMVADCSSSNTKGRRR